MKIKDKILNKVADLLSDYRTPKYDTILSMDVKGKVKGVLTTPDCTYIKELKEKEQSGLVSVTKLLDEEIGDSRYSDIYFCENDKVICIHNHSKNCYVETVHEFFDSAEEKIYLVCDKEDSYESLKWYIAQNGKYHDFLRKVDDIPNKKAFEKLFSKLDKAKEGNIDKEEKVEIRANHIEIKGKISNIGKEFKKRDGVLARFIDIVQESEYNGKKQKNVISVMLEGASVYLGKDLKLDEDICVVGKLNSYADKKNQKKTVIKCDDLVLLDKKTEQIMER